MNKWDMLGKIYEIVFWPYRKVRDYFEFKKRMKELRKRDPFIYK
jgi:hypothetical protein